MDVRTAELHQIGDAHYAAGRFVEAAEAYQQAIQRAATAPLLFNLGNAYRSLKQFGRAGELYDQALQLSPSMAVAQHNKALCLLHQGDLFNGFRLLEWRKLCPGFVDDARYRLPKPWQGESLCGRTLYIYAEYFQGDLIQFGRYALLAEAAGARVILSAPTSMHRLLQTMSSSLTLVPIEAPPPAHDYQAALMTLPALFGTAPDRVPRGASYLQADPDRVRRWRDKIGERGFKVGIAWHGSERANLRSFPLAMAASRLAALPGVRLISLQKHSGLDELDGQPVENLGPDFDPGPDAFLDTAAAMKACNLFITADTSVLHLGGALGVPTWAAIPFLEDWRWLEARSDSPWYPSLQLFRQEVRGEWPDVFDQMATVLGDHLRRAG
jgi:tetratricopeptide (TPR) repeat protein